MGFNLSPSYQVGAVIGIVISIIIYRIAVRISLYESAGNDKTDPVYENAGTISSVTAAILNLIGE